jgi:hypothetical protein
MDHFVNHGRHSAACWAAHLPAEYNLVFMIPVICFVCIPKECIFKPGVILIWIQPAYAGTIGKLAIKESFVDSVKMLLQRAVAAHCHSPGPPRISRAFEQGIYGTKKPSFFKAGLGMIYL